MQFSSMMAMVVEDDPCFRAVAELMLRLMGFNYVLAVEDGETAWANINLMRFDIVMSDWNMEPLSGLDLLRRVRANPATSRTQFVLMSANLCEEYWLEAIKAGATDFLVKPFSWLQLRDTVRIALNVRAPLPSNVVELPKHVHFMDVL